jgi:multidrug efflux pump subunit AcrA (membrane-fusion protein)
LSGQAEGQVAVQAAAQAAAAAAEAEAAAQAAAVAQAEAVAQAAAEAAAQAAVVAPVGVPVGVPVAGQERICVTRTLRFYQQREGVLRLDLQSCQVSQEQGNDSGQSLSEMCHVYRNSADVVVSDLLDDVSGDVPRLKFGSRKFWCENSAGM